MARKSFVATVAGIAAFAVPNAFADKGGIPHDGSNGLGRSAAQQQQQKAATAPQGKALAKGHSNAKANRSHANANAQTKSHGKSEAAKPSTESPQGPPASNTHAKAGKTTICHATGSATNPFVTITISNNALPAHMRHQDGRDIIPAPAGGCPTGQQTQTEQPPGTTEQTPPPTTMQTSAPATQQAAAQVLGETVTGSSPSKSGPTSKPSGGVLGATTSGSSPSASASPAATGTRASSSSSLPFTGTDAIIIAILGLAALLLGVTMRRAAAHKG